MPTSPIFSAATEAHRFIMAALPLRAPESLDLLKRFVAAAQLHQIPHVVMEAVLIRLLYLLGRQGGCCVESLPEQYLSMNAIRDPLERFEECAESFIRYRTVPNPTTRAVMALIDESFADATFRLASVAVSVNRSPGRVWAVFKRDTGLTVGDYLRKVRLERAATLLVSSHASIKEVWSATGFARASDFTHSFKKCFGLTPTALRGRSASIGPRQTSVGRSRADAPNGRAPSRPRTRHHRVLVADPDPVAQRLVAAYLETAGYEPQLASTGTDAIRLAIAEQPERILLEYWLPDMDGADVLRSIRAGVRNSPDVAVLTADWELASRRAEFRALNAALVFKPCEGRDLPGFS